MTVVATAVNHVTWLLAPETGRLAAFRAGYELSTVFDVDSDGLGDDGTDGITNSRSDGGINSRISAMSTSQSRWSPSIVGVLVIEFLDLDWYEIAAEGPENARKGDFLAAIATRREESSIVASLAE